MTETKTKTRPYYVLVLNKAASTPEGEVWHGLGEHEAADPESALALATRGMTDDEKRGATFAAIAGFKPLTIEWEIPPPKMKVSRTALSHATSGD